MRAPIEAGGRRGAAENGKGTSSECLQSVHCWVLEKRRGPLGCVRGQGLLPPEGKYFSLLVAGLCSCRAREGEGSLRARVNRTRHQNKRLGLSFSGTVLMLSKRKKHVKADKYPLLTLINACGFPWARSFLSAPAAQHRDGHEVGTAPSTSRSASACLSLLLSPNWSPTTNHCRNPTGRL